MSDQAVNEKKPLYRRIKRWQIITAIVLVAALARLWAAWQLPIDADEPTYLKAGYDYAQMIKAGDLGGILHYDYNQEHPALVKLMYSLPYLFIEPSFGVSTQMNIDRLISVLWGVLAVLALALIDPLAGAFLALDTMVIKYTSQVYLESLPLFAGLLALVALRRYLQDPRRRKWLWISAVSIGAAIAGKYLYALVGIPLLAMMFFYGVSQDQPQRHGGTEAFKNIEFTGRARSLFPEIALYLLVALAAFFVLDPSLWGDPVGRLWSSLTFHISYSTTSLDIVRADYPWYQALNWITSMVPWHPRVFIVPGPDGLIFWLALLGGYWEWKRFPWAVIWAMGVFLALLAWPTKWPQYTLTLIPALCLMASSGLRRLVAWFRSFNDYYNITENILPHPGKAFWVVLVLFLGAIGIGMVANAVAAAQARSGWTSVQSEITPLPSDALHALLRARDGRMVIASNAGVAFWQPDERAPWGESPQFLTTRNTGLVNERVLSMLEDRNEGWWFGTAAGLSYWDGKQGWTSYRAADLGLASDRITCLLRDSQGRVWVGTPAGAAAWDGETWKAVAGANNLGDATIFSMAEQSSGGRHYLWFGTAQGASRFDEQENTWQNYDLSSAGLGHAGVADLLVDQKGMVWAATTGNGLHQWDGQAWKTLRTSNSDIPLNSVTRVVETAPGVLWVGFSYASQPGGMVARFDGNTWQVFDSASSGYNGSEPTSLAPDGRGRMWIGSAFDGLQIYQGQ